MKITNEKSSYKNPLKANHTLEVFNNDELIFASQGKWLAPLFELEAFFKDYTGPKENLCLHDTAVGKAAAVLMIRMGIKHIHANLASRLAVAYVQELSAKNSFYSDLTIMYDSLVDRLLCATEDQLEHLTDNDEMYFLLRQRAKLVQGVDVKVENLSYKFGDIKNLSFELKAGGRLMILGENGAGKTTLLRLLANIYKPTEGLILIDGKTPQALSKYTVGYIPQQTDNTQFSLSVEEVVSLGLSRTAKNASAQIKNALKRTSALHLAGRSFASLSGGEKQKVSLARCLVQNANLLLLDEPTAALDNENRKMVTDILMSLTVTEIPTIIVVTHDKELSTMRGWQILRLGENASPVAQAATFSNSNIYSEKSQMEAN